MSTPLKVTKKRVDNDKESPTKQRTPLQLPQEKKVGIYFAQSKNAMKLVASSSDSSEHDDEESENYEITEDGSLKKRKQFKDPLSKKLAKIRKTFDSNITVVENEEDEFALKTENQNVVPSENKESPEKVLKEIPSIEANGDVKSNTVCGTNKKNDEEKVDSQLPESIESLDDLFDEDWSFNHKGNKKTANELDDFFVNDWSYETTIDLSEPKRCLIIDIVWEKMDFTMTVKDPKTEATEVVKCFGIWRYTKIQPGECVIVKAQKESPDAKYWTVDNNCGWIINQPDTLISGTSVVNALWCNRRSLFQEKFRLMESLPYYQGTGQFMLTGSLTHELIQTVLEKEIYEVKKINDLLNDILKSKHAIQMMYSAGVSMADCKNLMRPSIGQIYKFIQRYIKGVQPDAPDNNFDGGIEKICDIEENVWLPNLGLKGKIDLTVEVTTKSKNNLFPTVERRVLPLEIKTGRASFSNEHQGQLILYTMMMNMTERKTNSGLLLYLRENTMREVIGSYHAQRDLITLRNSVAYYSTREPVIMKTKDEEKVLPMELPKPINHHSCSKCTYKSLCCTYLTDGDRKEMHDGHHLKNLDDNVTSHLLPEHVEYVKKWITLMQIEEITENEDVFKWSDLWTMKPSKREKRGSCISGLKIIAATPKYGKFLLEFQRLKNSDNSKKEINTLEFSDDEYVIISTNSRINICTGYLDSNTSSSIFVRCEKDITKIYKDEEYHIDKSLYNSFLTHNLSQLGGLLDDHEICSKLRRIIIERRPATFSSDLPQSILETGKSILKRLNENQKNAVLKALAADDYLLIKGFPGTGKTQTLVAMIELLVKLDMSVLVTAHTNTALDNILVKLLELNVDFIRLGSTSRAHSALIEKCDDNLTSKCDSPEALHTLYCSKKVVGVTCYGSTHTHLSRRKFDVCIVDESTQVLQPTILRPLYCATKFVLVGDPEQLPPISKNNVARKMGINESLFARLDAKSNVVALTQQYRMNKCIMNIANKLTYNDQLQIGNEKVSISTIPVTNCADLELCERWIRKTLSLRLKNSVIMLNTSATYHLHLDINLEQKKSRNSNYWETAMILRLTEVLKNLGVHAQTIGVIAPYRAQVQLLRSIVSSDIEVNTVDQYQGRDKDVIIYSCSKSVPKDTDIAEFDILEDKQRLTVAVTRAKHKLIIVGDLNTLNRYTPFKKLIKALKFHDQIYDLKDGEDDFSFEDLIRVIV
ncbi:DNA replication ATP-dependent helicase/nuclease DNA2 [Copidosoma floridanum]|uniref:DNA replication ATP-dependent helicase/nuclease DNA2 n=1 Tax=Copidosoma floridanum TaxID=29053 RepID=UPI0006C9BA70|nr:DNA replication ATP-dependent helicase/nuclease DNA2 [Copidosoma floridanum]